MSNYKGSARWKFVVLFSIFAMIVVACGGEVIAEHDLPGFIHHLLGAVGDDRGGAAVQQHITAENQGSRETAGTGQSDKGDATQTR